MELRAKTKLREIGTSYGIIIPKWIVDALNLEGKEFDILIQESSMIKLIVNDVVKRTSGGKVPESKKKIDVF